MPHDHPEAPFDDHAAAGERGSRHGGESAAHLAFFYAGEREYLDGIMTFLSPALTAGEPMAVAVPGPRARQLAEHLGGPRSDLQVLDMYELGRNPARIIPAVLSMLDAHRGRRLHYVGEPIWPGRTAAEIQEATRHEALINLAWPEAPIRVLCPYDAGRLPAAVLRDAEMTHPCLLDGAREVASARYLDSRFPEAADRPLPPPPDEAVSLGFGVVGLSAARALVSELARSAGLATARVEDLVIAVNEVATNAVKHAGGRGSLRVWSTRDEVICQLEDPGHIADPLAGRHRPVPGVDGGLGLWMVNQLCDLVEVRTGPGRTTVRLHVRLG